MLEFIKVEDGYIKFTEDEFKDLLNKYKNYLLDKINFDDLDEVYTHGYEDGYNDCLYNKACEKYSSNKINDKELAINWLEDLLEEIKNNSK